MQSMMEKLVITSPTNSKIAQGKNLTGIPRILRDMAVDVHNNIQQWNNLHLRGLSILKTICYLKSAEVYTQDVQGQCDKLEEICSSLDQIIQSLSQINDQVKNISALHRLPDKLFKSWPISSFSNVTEIIHKAFNNEAKVKREIYENIAHYSSESTKMLHLAAWVHQPFLPYNLSIILESLLIETGHR
ncbi:cyclin-dependent kinase 2-interacting protein [Prorops nasuta]|uniref:cyclin-dependent kinase 2-interacting protein n=1 Tax=Prorops nasuta TaxID=863751 RepID=UPI0034CE3BFD